MKTKRAKYEVELGGKWLVCKKAEPTPKGWLHYELPDGTNGLCRPGTWRPQEQGK